MTSAEMRDKLKKKEKVAIVGFADSKTQAPYKDESWEIWGLNSLFEHIPKWDLWFEIHDRVKFGIDTNKEVGYGLTRTGQPYLQALAQLKCNIIMVEQYPDIPNSLRYPIEEIICKYDPLQRDKKPELLKLNDEYNDWNGYFTNSISYMLALAIDWGYKEIGIWGVDMATATEYGSQRPSCEYYLGVALGKGIKLTVPPESDLLKTVFIYGFQDEAKRGFESKLNLLATGMQERLNQSSQQHDLSQKQIDQYIGALECLKEVRKIRVI